ncbi:hypothetical protein GGQ05_001923 [Salinibacter ruber]|nr:hypothetical protein [Salinibacter ruber]
MVVAVAGAAIEETEGKVFEERTGGEVDGNVAAA